MRFVPPDEAMLEEMADISAAAPDPWSRQSLENYLHAPGKFCRAAVDAGGRVAGFACFSQVGETADLEMVAVAPAARRRGVARQLLGHCFAELRAQGATRCLLELREGNRAALGLYEGLGFCTLAARPGMYAHPAEDGRLMEKEL